MKDAKESVHLGEGNPSVFPWGPGTVDQAFGVPAPDGLGTHSQSSGNL